MKSPIKRIGIIGSSGGSALISAYSCLKRAGINLNLVVITDRECGLEKWAHQCGFSVTRLDYKNPEEFSRNSLEIFLKEQCDEVLLFYTRRVSAPLIYKLRVWNIHPSLLPAFPGLNAIQQAFTAGVRVFGATLHIVDSGLDTGPIYGQVATVMPESMSLKSAMKISHYQKVWLILVWYQLISQGSIRAPSFLTLGLGGSIAYPSINDNVEKVYRDWLFGEVSSFRDLI